MKRNNYKTLDLFAGIGGIRLGFENAGFETVFGNDFDPYCKVTYDLNFKTTSLKVTDIAKIKSSDLGKLAEWLRKNAKLFHIEDGVLYVHAGIPVNPDGKFDFKIAPDFVVTSIILGVCSP